MRLISKQGDMLDKLCWQYYGQTTAVVELTLNANPQLAFMPAILPIGTVVDMPDLTNAKPETPQVQLWD